MSLIETAVLSGHTDRVWCVSWHPRGDRLASCGGDRSVRVWVRTEDPTNNGAAKWSCEAVLDKEHKRTIRCVAWSPCGKFLACASFDSSVTIYEFSGNGGLHVASTLEGHENEVKCVAWNSEGNMLATCSRDKTVHVWERTAQNDFEMAAVLHGHQQDVKYVTFHPYKELVFSASYDDTVRQWQEEPGGYGDEWTCTDILSSHTSTVWSIAFERVPAPSDDDNDVEMTVEVGRVADDRRERANHPRLVSCSDDATLIVWQHLPQVSTESETENARTWQNSCTLSGYHTRAVYSVDWSFFGAIASCGSDNTIRVFEETNRDLKAGTSSWVQMASVENPLNTDINCVRWHPSPTQRILASAGDDCLIRIWTYAPPATPLC